MVFGWGLMCLFTSFDFCQFDLLCLSNCLKVCSCFDFHLALSYKRYGFLSRFLWKLCIIFKRHTLEPLQIKSSLLNIACKSLIILYFSSACIILISTYLYLFLELIDLREKTATLFIDHFGNTDSISISSDHCISMQSCTYKLCTKLEVT